MVGFITLTGIASRNGILKISHYINLAAREPDLWALIIRGSLERMTPVLMTALAAGLALLPHVNPGSPGKEVLPRRRHVSAGCSTQRCSMPSSRRSCSCASARPLASIENAREAQAYGLVHSSTPTERGDNHEASTILISAAAGHDGLRTRTQQGGNGGVQVDAGNNHVELVAKDRP
jgi:hypothetical protein